MKIFIINIQEPYCTQIINGQKSVEGRLNKGKFNRINIGDAFLINSQYLFEIIKKNHYPSFKEMLTKERLKNVFPDKRKIADAMQIYDEFYNKEQEKEFGIVAVKIKFINNY